MQQCASNEKNLSAETLEFYRRVLSELQQSGIPFLVGGAYAFGCYTGIIRDTKDLDVFARPHDAIRILSRLSKAGYATNLRDDIWLGKAEHGEYLVDVIFSSANGIASVDDEWFTYAYKVALFNVPTEMVPAEEMIWSKAFVMTRDRYDGADVAHLLHACAEELDWWRLLRRFSSAATWRVLYNHLILFGFIYPSEQARIPRWVMDELSARLNTELNTPFHAERECRGTYLSSTQYNIDIEEWGYRDPRTREPAPGLLQ